MIGWLGLCGAIAIAQTESAAPINLTPQANSMYVVQDHRWAPLAFRNQQGNPDGLIIDIWRLLGKRIVLLHLHGTKRRPAGSVGDEMPWAEIIAALKEIGITGVIVTYEPFSDEVRDKAGEALWKGLPPAVTEPSGIIATRATLVQHGMTFMST